MQFLERDHTVYRLHNKSCHSIACTVLMHMHGLFRPGTRFVHINYIHVHVHVQHVYVLALKCVQLK